MMRLGSIVSGFAGFALCTTVASVGVCGSLMAPFSLDSAAVLPQGVGNARVTGFTTEVGNRYDSSGQIVPLANAFNKPVTWKELLDTVPPGFDRGQLKGGLQSAEFGVKLGDQVGDARGLVNTRLTVTTPVLAYGVTKELTLGLGIPVVYSNMSASTGWSVNSEFQKNIDRMIAGGYNSKVLAFKAKLQNVVATKIASYGYKPIENESRTEIGDINLGAKYQVFNRDEVLFGGDRFAAALAPKIVLPTGRAADVDKVIDVAPGDGQWDVGLSGVVDYSPNQSLTLTSGAGYTHQVGSTRAKRVPQSSSESISPDVDPAVYEKLGDTASLGLAAKYKIQGLWTVSAGSTYQHKFADSYEGSMYASERYGYMAQDTEQNMVSGQVGVSFSTVPLFSEKRFQLPLEASVNYSQVVWGQNVNQIGLTSFDLSAYF